MALLSRHEEIANTLVSHNCDLDILDPSGNSLLHLAILRGDSFAASFLVKKGANTILARKELQETPLHMVAAYNPSQVHMHACTHICIHVTMDAGFCKNFARRGRLYYVTRLYIGAAVSSCKESCRPCMYMVDGVHILGRSMRLCYLRYMGGMALYAVAGAKV